MTGLVHALNSVLALPELAPVAIRAHSNLTPLGLPVVAVKVNATDLRATDIRAYCRECKHAKTQTFDVATPYGAQSEPLGVCKAS